MEPEESFDQRVHDGHEVVVPTCMTDLVHEHRVQFVCRQPVANAVRHQYDRPPDAEQRGLAAMIAH
jgi:hypothetical protein